MAETFKALLLDIEGTTTSISFVKDVFFPYAYDNAEAFLTAHQNDPQVQEVFESLRSLSNEEAATDTDIQHCPGAPEGIVQIVKNVRTWIKKDKKLTALKTLQGLIWEEAYKKGEVQGHLYDDVEPTLEALHAKGIPIYIFSSGSVQAQKLLFAHSTEGDLTPILSGYFDTAIGAKVNAESYREIAEQIGTAAKDILFLTDVDKEALAAHEAGLQVKVVIRPGNAPLSEDSRSCPLLLHPGLRGPRRLGRIVVLSIRMGLTGLAMRDAKGELGEGEYYTDEWVTEYRCFQERAGWRFWLIPHVGVKVRTNLNREYFPEPHHYETPFRHLRNMGGPLVLADCDGEPYTR